MGRAYPSLHARRDVRAALCGDAPLLGLPQRQAAQRPRLTRDRSARLAPPGGHHPHLAALLPRVLSAADSNDRLRGLLARFRSGAGAHPRHGPGERHLGGAARAPRARTGEVDTAAAHRLSRALPLPRLAAARLAHLLGQDLSRRPRTARAQCSGHGLCRFQHPAARRWHRTQPPRGEPDVFRRSAAAFGGGDPRRCGREDSLPRTTHREQRRGSAYSHRR